MTITNENIKKINNKKLPHKRQWKTILMLFINYRFQIFWIISVERATV